MSHAGSEPRPDEGASTDPSVKRLDNLVESTAAVRGDLALVAEVLALLTQLAEVGDEHLRGLAVSQEALLGQQRTLVTGAIGELTRTLTTDVHRLTSGLAELVARTAVLDDLGQGLASTRDAVARLASRADQTEAAGRGAADAQNLALARVTDVADTLTASVESLRTTITDAIETSSQTTLGPIGMALNELSSRIDALPEPDQGPVAAQLARLSAIITSQTRHDAATAGDIHALSRSLDDAVRLMTQQLERQADATTEVWTYLAKQPSPAEHTDDLHYAVGRATASLQAAMEHMAAEVAALRVVRTAASTTTQPVAPRRTAGTKATGAKTASTKAASTKPSVAKTTTTNAAVTRVAATKTGVQKAAASVTKAPAAKRISGSTRRTPS